MEKTIFVYCNKEDDYEDVGDCRDCTYFIKLCADRKDPHVECSFDDKPILEEDN